MNLNKEIFELSQIKNAIEYLDDVQITLMAQRDEYIEKYSDTEDGFYLTCAEETGTLLGKHEEVFTFFQNKLIEQTGRLISSYEKQESNEIDELNQAAMVFGEIQQKVAKHSVYKAIQSN